MRLSSSQASLAALLVASVTLGGCATEMPEKKPSKNWTECQGTDQALARRSLLAVAGRQPWGQAEVNVYEDVVRGLRDAGLDEREVRTRLVSLMAADELYLPRWADFFLDALRIPRRTTSSYFGNLNAACFGPVAAPDDRALAEWIRDSGPLDDNPDFANFTMARLLTSSILLDDLSPYYRASLFHLMSLALQGNNVERLKLEWTRRRTLGEVFGEIYLNRDITCLRCHNSQFSVTYSDDPEKNRAWPVAGYFEAAIFGASDASADPMSYYSIFRHLDVVALGTDTPWRWSLNFCKPFHVPTDDDPLGFEVSLGSIRASAERPTLGRRASVWNLEYALRRGIDGLSEAGGIQRDPSDPNQIVDPDQALAYLLSMSVAEDVWEEVVGAPLTIANHFPRTEVQRDTLTHLADAFSVSHFSLKSLLAEIVAHPAFNLSGAAEGCGGGPYALPRLLNPWTDRESAPEARGNGVGDAVFARSPRPLLRSLHHAMGWPALADFPKGSAEGDYQASVGFFLSSSEPGFRGFSAEARLAWEASYGRCGVTTPDYVSGLIERGASQGSTLEEIVVALKDHLVGEPWIAEGERAPIEAILGASLTDTGVSEIEPRVRLVCGAYLSSPQFLLGGLSVSESRDIPRLTDEMHTYDAICGMLALRVTALNPSWVIECSPGSLRVSLS